MIIKPKTRGFICVTTHPEGCRRNVLNQIAHVEKDGPITGGPKKVLVIGCSTGFGFSSRVTAAFGSGAATLGVCFEKPGEEDKPATAGYYNSWAFEQEAHKKGLYAKTINGDAFSREVKEKVVALIKKDLGKVDAIIYSLASPKRLNPVDGVLYSSCLKTIGQPYTSKTVDTNKNEVKDVTIEPASPEEINGTIKVMGGEDWRMWMDVLLEADVLEKGAMTVAYSYIGPVLTFPVYRHGTIGKAKEDLEKTAGELDAKLKNAIGGRAFVSVNKALVTQASSAIPVVPLYIALLYKVMKEKGTHEGCIEQMNRLFRKRLYTGGPVPVDEKGLIRIDDWEMAPDVQAEVDRRWKEVNTENLSTVSDYAGYKHEFLKLFGFEVDGINYEADVAVNQKIGDV